jgi:hypothetical protein
MSLLLQNVEEIETYRDDAPAAFGAALSVLNYHQGAVEIELPSKDDFKSAEEFDSDYDPENMRNYLIANLAPCAKVGELALDMEGVSLDALLAANAECKAALLDMKEELPRLFECPIELGLCADAQPNAPTVEVEVQATTEPENYATDQPRERAGEVTVNLTASPPRGCPRGCTTYPSWCEPPIKGNSSFDDGELIYHMPTDEYYEETKINPRYGEYYFCTPEEAEAAGFRRAYQ